MSWNIVNTLWGLEVQNSAPKCKEPNCDEYANNAGNGRYHPLCPYHHKLKYEMDNFDYKKYRKSFCENVDGRLGYKCTSTIVAERWQLEVDHIDGNNSNNQVSNLQTLCSCCHRYKTMLNEENLPKHKRKKHVEDLFQEMIRTQG